MKALKDTGGYLTWTSADSPPLQALSVRIKVAATALNRADLVQRAGHYPPPPGVTEILGLECSGVVKEVAEGVDWPKPGERVCALLAGGGYAEEVVVPASHVLPLPEGLSLTESAALPEVLTTAWLNLKQEGCLAPGERVLVHAGMSGVGTAAIQLCRAWGNPVVVTVGSEEKCREALLLGAERAVNRKEGPWGPKVCEGGKFDLILDPVGGSYLESNIHALKPRGRLINIGLMGGQEGTLPLGPLLSKRLQIKGSVLRSRSKEEKDDILRAMKKDVWPLLEKGSIRPMIHATFPIQEAEAAHKLMASNETVGKILLLVSEA